MHLTRSSIATGTGSAEWFTGQVYVDTVTSPTAPSRLQAASVHFAPGARTAWHTHPVGQTIGLGRCRAEAARSRSSAPATASTLNPVRITGTAPRQTAS